jgi:hypothetical protein
MTALLLFAIVYDVLPQMREQRNSYYQFWDLLGVVAISGWLVAVILFRIRTLRQPALTVLVGAVPVVGALLGYGVWLSLADYSWSDLGVTSRASGELTVCCFGCVGWLFVGSWFVLCRK